MSPQSPRHPGQGRWKTPGHGTLAQDDLAGTNKVSVHIHLFSYKHNKQSHFSQTKHLKESKDQGGIFDVKASSEGAWEEDDHSSFCCLVHQQLSWVSPKCGEAGQKGSDLGRMQGSDVIWCLAQQAGDSRWFVACSSGTWDVSGSVC